MKGRSTWPVAVAIFTCVVVVSTACARPGGASSSSGDTTKLTEDFVQASSMSGCPSPACSDILAQVESGAKTDTIPPDLTPSLADVESDMRVPDGGQCSQLPISGLKPEDQPCTFDTGAPTNAPMVVLIGDSQAWMWSLTVNAIARQHGYRFGLVYHAGCHMPMVTFETTQAGVTDAQCREWKNAAIEWLKQHNPALVLVASGHHTGIKDAEYTAGYAATLTQMQGPGRKLFVMGDVPLLKQDPPRCLAAHTSSALKCATKTSTAAPAHEQQAALNAARQAGAGYVNLTPWLCTADLCPAIVGHYVAYQDQWHITDTYAQALMPLVQQAIGLTPAS